MILSTIKNAFAVARTARENVNAFGALSKAYDEGAALPGLVLAFTGSTKSKVDDLAMAGVMEVVDSIHTTVSRVAATAEFASQTAAAIAFELRSVERFVARLRGGESMKSILEGES